MFIKRSAFIWGAEKRLLESVQRWISIRRDWRVDSGVDRMQSFLNKRRYPFIASTVQLVKVRYPLLASTSACGWLAWFYIYTCRDIIFYMVHLAIVLFGEGEKSLWYLFRSRSVDRQSTTIGIWINVIVYFLYTVGCFCYTLVNLER